jgi:hypothetical protein
VATASERGWGDPWAKGFREANIVTVAVPHRGHAGHETGIALAVHRRVAALAVAFLVDLQARPYEIDAVRDDWGYDLRCQRGTGPGTGRPCVTSNHAWGLAIDVNATRNPMRWPLTTDLPPGAERLAMLYGFRWGGRWSNPDPMHFEFSGSPADADRLVSTLPLTPQEVRVLVPDIVATCLDPNGVPDAKGRVPFWAAKADGSVFAFNGAPFHGSAVGHTSAVVGIHPRLDRPGYVLVTNDADASAGAATFAFPVV